MESEPVEIVPINEMELANCAEESGEISKETKNDDYSKKEEVDEIEHEPLQPMTEEEEMRILETFSDADPKHLQHLLSFYRSMDKGRYGYITIQHFSYAVKTLKPHMKDKEILKIFVDLDADHDGLVGLEEYLREMTKPLIKDEQDLMKAFEGMDKDMDGFLSAEDLKASAAECGIMLTDFEIVDILKQAYSEKNKMTFREFCKYSRKLPDQKIKPK